MFQWLRCMPRKLMGKESRGLVVIHDGAGHGAYDAQISGREVVLYKPPVILNADGSTMRGISHELVAEYLVASVAELAETDLGVVGVQWKKMVGRFALTTLSIDAWGYKIDIVQPIATVSKEASDAFDIYRTGLVLKLRQMHRGYQNFNEANGAIRRAIRALEILRNEFPPHFNDPEYLFIMAEVRKALVQSALVPVLNTPNESIMGRKIKVKTL